MTSMVMRLKMTRTTHAAAPAAPAGQTAFTFGDAAPEQVAFGFADEGAPPASPAPQRKPRTTYVATAHSDLARTLADMPVGTTLHLLVNGVKLDVYHDAQRPDLYIYWTNGAAPCGVTALGFLLDYTAR